MTRRDLLVGVVLGLALALPLAWVVVRVLAGVVEADREWDWLGEGTEGR